MLCRAIFEKKRSRAQLKQRAKDNWACWRLILSDCGGFDYNTVFFQMTPQQIAEANIALDIMIQAQKRAAKARGR